MYSEVSIGILIGGTVIATENWTISESLTIPVKGVESSTDQLFAPTESPAVKEKDPGTFPVLVNVALKFTSFPGVTMVVVPGITIDASNNSPAITLAEAESV